MNIFIKKHYGFTLVELIIVITILAILATIAFVSFSGYTGNSRDSNRLFSIKEISKSLTIQKELTGNFPVPDDIYATGGINPIKTDLFNVGIIGKGVSNYIKLGSIPLDPKTKNEYSYGLTKDNKYFQVAGTLENGEVLGYKLVSQTYANGELKASVEGNYKGVLKFTHNSKSYIGRIPSLIFSRDGTYEGADNVFVLNNEKNLPYKVNENNLGLPKILTSTGVEITASLKIDELVQNNEWKDISKEIIEEEISGKLVVNGGGNLGNTQNNTCPTNPTDESFFTFNPATKTITGYNNKGGVDNIVIIPCKIGGVDVEHIGDYAFRLKIIKSVEIPNTVKTIGEGAFYSNAIESLIIPDSVTSIGSYAFGWNRINNLKISNRLTKIPDSAFHINQLKSVVIPDGITEIGEYAFNNSNLTEIVIPSSVTNIGQYAFQNNKLTVDKITIKCDLPTFGENVFIANGPGKNIKIDNPITCTP